MQSFNFLKFYLIMSMFVFSCKSIDKNDNLVLGCYGYGNDNVLEFTHNGLGYNYFYGKDQLHKQVFSWKLEKDFLIINFGSNELYFPAAPTFYGMQKTRIGFSYDGNCDELFSLSTNNNDNKRVSFGLKIPVFGKGITYDACLIKDEEFCSFDFVN